MVCKESQVEPGGRKEQVQQGQQVASSKVAGRRTLTARQSLDSSRCLMHSKSPQKIRKAAVVCTPRWYFLSPSGKERGLFPPNISGESRPRMAPVFVPFACSVVAFVSSRNFSVSSRKMTQCSAAAALQSLPSLLDKGGKELTLSATKSKLQGKRVALFFSAGWCPMVRCCCLSSRRADLFLLLTANPS